MKLNTRLRSVAQEEIRELFKKDVKSHLPTLQLHKSRDVSHLKDLNSVRSLTSLVNLPTDIRTLRLLVDPKSKKNIQKAKVCKKKNCFEQVVSLSPDIQGLDLNEQAVPTGRKEAENLLRWFREMKKKYGMTDEFDVVVLITEQEVLKQVRGQCKHLGIVLKNVLRYHRNLAENQKKKHIQDMEAIKFKCEAKITKEAESFKENIENLENKLKEQMNLIEKQKSLMNDIQEDSNFYKTKLNEVQRLYLTEQDIWRKKSLKLIRESVRKTSVITHDSYKLAVARWRKDLFHDEIDNQPNILLPEVIRDKLENEQPLTAEELRIYRELYYKAEEEKYLKRFSDSETQTEFREGSREQDSTEKHDLDSSDHIGLNIEKGLEAVFDPNIINSEGKEVQVNLDLEYQADDDVLKELEKYLTVDEHFELLQLAEKIQPRSLNTSFDSESSKKLPTDKEELEYDEQDLLSDSENNEIPEEMTEKIDLAVEKIIEICTNLNIFHGNRWIAYARNFKVNSFEDVVENFKKIKEIEQGIRSFSINELEDLLMSLKNSGPDDVSAGLYHVFQNELKKIKGETFGG